jgi:hypothetical protein
MIFEPLQSLIDGHLNEYIDKIVEKKIEYMLENNIISVEKIFSGFTEKQTAVITTIIVHSWEKYVDSFANQYNLNGEKNIDELYKDAEILKEMVKYLNDKDFELYQLFSEYYQDFDLYKCRYLFQTTFDNKNIILFTRRFSDDIDCINEKTIELSQSALLNAYLHEHMYNILMERTEYIFQQYLNPIK